MPTSAWELSCGQFILNKLGPTFYMIQTIPKNLPNPKMHSFKSHFIRTNIHILLVSSCKSRDLDWTPNFVFHISLNLIVDIIPIRLKFSPLIHQKVPNLFIRFIREWLRWRIYPGWPFANSDQSSFENGLIIYRILSKIA